MRRVAKLIIGEDSLCRCPRIQRVHTQKERPLNIFYSFPAAGLAALWIGQAASAGTILVTGSDSAAIQAAIARSAPGDTVRLPAGVYAVTGTITLKSHITVAGAGIGKTILRAALTVPSAMVSMSGCEDTGIEGLALDGAGDPNTRQGITAGSSRRLRLSHLAIRNFPSGQGPLAIAFSGINPTRAGGVTDSEVTDCVIENIGVDDPWGCGMRMSWGSSRNRVLRNTIRETGRGGIFANDGSTDLVIQENTVSGSHGEGLGIEIWGGCDRSVVEDNQIDHWLSLSGADGCAVRRNVISDQSGKYKACGIEDVAASDCVLTDNRVDGGQGVGLSASNKPPKNYNFWGYDTFRDCNQWGAQLQGEEGGVGWQYFYRCRFVDNPVGKGAPRYPDDSGHGFRTNGNAHHLTLEECDISGNGRFGLQLGGSGVDFLSFVRCTIRDNKGAAVSGPGEYTALEWKDCNVERNGSNHLPEAKPFPHPAPTARFAAPPNPRAGKPVAFTDQSTAASGAIKQVLWDFGDGLPSTEPSSTHIYSRPGEYRVTLVVWDDSGRGARMEQRIRVR